MIFVPAVKPPDSRESRGYWFVFQENRMLVRVEDLPRIPDKVSIARWLIEWFIEQQPDKREDTPHA